MKQASAAFIAAILVTWAPSASAQPVYPSKPVRIVVPSSAGGGTDIIARIVAPRLTQSLGQQIVIDHRPGAGTMIGGKIVAKSPPDGYTLLTCVSTLAILQTPEVKEKFAADGGDPAGTSPEEFGRYIKSETEKWQKVAKSAGITPE